MDDTVPRGPDIAWASGKSDPAIDFRPATKVRSIEAKIAKRKKGGQRIRDDSDDDDDDLYGTDPNNLPLSHEPDSRTGPATEDIKKLFSTVPPLETEEQAVNPRRNTVSALLSVVQKIAVPEVRREAKVHSIMEMLRLRAVHMKRSQLALGAHTTSAALVDAVYVLVSVPLRIGFMYDPWNGIDMTNEWTRTLTVLSILDLIGEIARLAFIVRERTVIFAKQKRKQRSRSARLSLVEHVTSHFANVRRSVVVPEKSIVSLRKSKTGIDTVNSKGAVRRPSLNDVEEVSSVREPLSSSSLPRMMNSKMTAFAFFLPLELVAAYFSYNLIHVARLLKYLAMVFQLRWVCSSILKKNRSFRIVRLLSFSTLSTPFHFCWVGFYLCHVIASGYMFLAHFNCGINFDQCGSTLLHPGCWAIKDKLEHASTVRKYLRALYWAVKSVSTLGQGDILPTNEMETYYCILVQLLSGMWATGLLAACSFYFTRRDGDLGQSVSTRLEQALLFLKSRKTPTEISTAIQAYYDYMQRTRNGIEERSVLAEMPQQYRLQCANYLAYRYMRKIPFFSQQPKPFMKTVLGLVEKDFFSPNQIIARQGDSEELIVIARGEIRVVHSESREIEQVLMRGEWIGEKSLYQDTNLKKDLVAGTFCDIFCLSRQNLRAALSRHFAKFKISLMMAQHRRQAVSDEDTKKCLQFVNPNPPVSKHNTIVNRTTRRMTNAVGRRTLLLNVMQRDFHLAGGSGSLHWRYPRSRFRLLWRRIKVACLIFLSIEVPFEIAFDWRVSILHDDTILRQKLSFMVSAFVEFVLYIDLFFRARRFIRLQTIYGRKGNTSPPKSSQAPSEVASIIHSFKAMTDSDDSRRERNQESIRVDTTVDIASGEATAKSKSVNKWQEVSYTRPQDIFHWYLLHDNVVADCLATVPIALIWKLIDKTDMNINAMLWMRFTRLLALGRLLPLWGSIQKIMTEYGLSPSAKQLVSIVISCIIAANIVGCFFFLVADSPEYVDGYPTGDYLRTDAECLEDASLYGNCTWFIADLSKFQIQSRYVRSIHWSLVLLSTVGYGDIHAISTIECLLALMWIFVGSIICYFTACAISSVVTQVTILSSMQRERLNEIKRALVHCNISRRTRNVIQRHYETKWKLNGSTVIETELQSYLPRSLRNQLALSMYAKLLQECYILSPCEYHQAFLRELALRTHSEIFVPNVTILHLGHLIKEMYIVQSGDVEVLLQSESEQVRLSAYRPSQARMMLNSFMSGSRLSWWLRGFFASKPLSSFISPRLSLARLSVSSLTGDLLPMAILCRGACFGEESLLSGEQFVSRVNARAVTSTQVAVLPKEELRQLAEKFPQQLDEIADLVAAKRRSDTELYRTLKQNLKERGKVKEFLGGIGSLHVSRKPQDRKIIAPDSALAVIWQCLHASVLMYNFFSITFRIAFLPYPSEELETVINGIDYFNDLILFAHIYLAWGRLGYYAYGEKIIDPSAVKERYKSTTFQIDCWSMLPPFYYGNTFYTALLRLPRLLRSPQLLPFIDEMYERLRDIIYQSKRSTIMLGVFDLVKFLLFFLAAAHQVGSLFFTLGRLQIEYGLASKSWVNVDKVLALYPEKPIIQYLRSIYWCLETFTVVCFGDIFPRNGLETIYASCTCIIGWIAIGYVVGKITSLMSNLDKDEKDHRDRVNDFELYSSRLQLPAYLRERSLESLDYKSKCQLEINIRKTFKDLPISLQVILFDELYGPVLRKCPEFSSCLSRPQIEALACEFTLELYLPEDAIVEEGRIGTKLYIMQKGRGEWFAAGSKITFAGIHEGVMFGDLAFFLPGTRYMASARAVKSSQVLMLRRRQWMKLWPDKSRRNVERKLLPLIKSKHIAMTKAFINIIKNFEVSKYDVSTHANRHQRGHTTSNLNALKPLSSKESAPDVSEDCPDRPQLRDMKTNTAQVSRRKLSSHFDMQNHPAKSLDATSAEAHWKRHQKNLLMLSLIDQHNRMEAEITYRDRRVSNVEKTGGLEALHLQKRISPRLKEYHRGDSSKMVVDEEATRNKPNLEDAQHVGLRNEPTGDRTKSCVHLPSATAQGGTVKLFSNKSVKNNFSKLLPTNRRNPFSPDEKKLVQKRRRHSLQGPTQEYRKSLESVQLFSNDMPIPGVAHRGSITTAARKLQLTPGLDLQSSANATKPRTANSKFPFASFNLLSVVRQMRPKSTLGQGLGVANARDDTAVGNYHQGDQATIHHESAPSEDPALDGIDEIEHLRVLLERWRRRQRKPGLSKKSSVVLPMDQTLEYRNLYQIWVEPPPPHSMMLESSYFRRFWNVLMLLICWYYVLVVPFRAAFDYEALDHVDERHVTTTLWFMMEYVCDLLCVIDFIFNCRYFAFIDRGEVVTEPKAIFEHYYHDGSFLSDLLVIFPFEVFLPFYSVCIGKTAWPTLATVTWFQIAILRMTKMLRIIHLHELGDRVQRMILFDMKLSSVRMSYLFFIRCALDFILGAHWLCCAFFAISFNTYNEDVPSWLTTPDMLSFLDIDGAKGIASVPLKTRFFRSYHFSIGAVTTVSYGDITPQNAVETLVVVVIIVFSVVFFGMLSGGFFQLLEGELGRRADYEERVARVAHFMVFHRLQLRVWKQLQLYFSMHWQESRGLDETQQLRGVTTAVKNDIALFVKRQFVAKLPLFASCEEAFIRAVVIAFEQELYVRSDVIIAEGDTGRSLYVIETGQVLVRVPKKPPKRDLKSFDQKHSEDSVVELIKTKYDFFGEKSLVLDMPRSATCIALSSCRMLLLTVDKYEDILEEFPEYREKNMREWIFVNLPDNNAHHATPESMAKKKAFCDPDASYDPDASFQP